MLTTTVALAPFSRSAGLPSHLRAGHSGQANGPRVQAETFEAYLAALEREKGYQAVYNFAFPIFSPIIHKHMPALLKKAKLAGLASPATSAGPAGPGGGGVEIPPSKAWDRLQEYVKSVGESLQVKSTSRGRVGKKGKLRCCTIKFKGFETKATAQGKAEAQAL